ncbi:MAG: hypothetical protein RLY87_695 [Chloroflexota bacterium]
MSRLSFVVDTSASPHAVLRPLPLQGVTIRDRFWAPRIATNTQVTLPSQYTHCEDTERIANFRRAAGTEAGEFVGLFFNDSDVYKWLEAVGWNEAISQSPALAVIRESVVADIVAAQRTDGYLNSYFTKERADERWTNFDLHEMYCAGHFFQAAIAIYRTSGDRVALDAACKMADHIDATFGPASDGKRPITDGHPEVELALVELYRLTREQRYLTLADFMVSVRGANQLGNQKFDNLYYQDHKPYRELHDVVGHAVRMLYLAAGATDLWLETGEPALKRAIDAQWHNMTQKRMYVSGGVGSRWHGEAIGDDYELPNATAYTETCAAIASVMWNWRLLQGTGDAKYADLMEWTLYNGVMPGLSVSGNEYFYQNPLENDGTHRRSAWFGCACCPPNVARLLAQLGSYVASVDNSSLWVHTYMQADIDTAGSGLDAAISVTTEYPWDNTVRISITRGGQWTLRARIPSWASGATVTVGGVRQNAEPNTYVALSRAWQVGDEVVLVFPMQPRLIMAHPSVTNNNGRVAVARGPMLYCIEQADHSVPIASVRLDPRTAWSDAQGPASLGVHTVLAAKGVSVATPDDALYAPWRHDASQPVRLTLIPYHLWANRSAGAMTVWIPLA